MYLLKKKLDLIFSFLITSKHHKNRFQMLIEQGIYSFP